MEKTFYTPILLLCFNRPEQTQTVFDTIRAVRPQKLYVAIDAPREGREDDIPNNAKVKEIVHNVDWPCEAHYLEQKTNLGCSTSGYTAWKWICETEERFLFIEDDGVASQSGFYFIQEMLERYDNDDRIAYVGGVNYGPVYGPASYFFSRYPCPTYFMGTWRRTIERYEFGIESFPATRFKHSFISSFYSLPEYLVRCQSYSNYYRDIRKGLKRNTYDIQMGYLAYKYNLLSIYPNVNLVTNIGFAQGATNGGDQIDEADPFFKEYANRKRFEMTDVVHPEKVAVDRNFEKRFFKKRILFLRPWYYWFAYHIAKRYFYDFYLKYVKHSKR